MNRPALWLILFSIISLTGCALFRPLGSKPHQQGDLLKKACLEAAVIGIKTEITRYQEWIELRKQNQADSQDLPGLEEGLEALKAGLIKYQSLNPKDYHLPEEIKSEAWVEGLPGANAILHVEGMSRSGPWYHLAGIKGDEYSALKPGIKYKMSFYKVYPRSYFHMESSYVYIAEIFIY